MQNLTCDFVGIIQNDTAAGQKATVILPHGISECHTGMTPGALQYLDDNGRPDRGRDKQVHREGSHQHSDARVCSLLISCASPSYFQD